MTKIQIINNGNSITTVKYDGDTIIFEVNDKLDYKTGGIVENPKEIKFKPDGVVNEITFNKRELELAESLYQTTPPLNTKSYEGEIFNDSSFSSSGTKQEQYRKKEIDKNRRLRKELKKARKKIAELKVKPESDKEITFPCPNRFEYIFEINERQEDDFYATPTEEVENILSHEYIKGTVLDPCCGMGHMVQGIPGHCKVIATDLIDRGFGEGGLDFLSPEYPYTKDIRTVIMNPPFKLITEFVLRGLEIAENKLIVLARIQFLETIGRYESVFKDNPPNRVYQYIDRISCAKNGDFTKLENSMMYAWFVWDKNIINQQNTHLKWIRRTK